jgi:hypothetical protein
MTLMQRIMLARAATAVAHVTIEDRAVLVELVLSTFGFNRVVIGLSGEKGQVDHLTARNCLCYACARHAGAG